MKSLLIRASALTLALALLLLPGASFAQVGTSKSLPDPISRMYDELAKVTSIQANSVLSASITAGGERVDLTLKLNSVSDTKDKTEVDFTLTASSNGATFKSAVGASSATIRGTLRTVAGGKAYLYLEQLPNIKNADIDLNAFEGKWIDLTKGLPSDYVELSGKDTFKKAIQRIKSAHTKYPAFTFTESGSTGSAYRYAVSVDPRYLEQFMAEANGDSVELKSLSPIEYLEKLRNWNISFTISKQTFLPQAISASFVLSESKGMKSYSVNLSFSTQYASFNKPVTIAKPKNTTTFEKLLESVTGKLSTERTKGNDAMLKSYLSAARTEAELYYDSSANSYSGFCNSQRFKALAANMEGVECQAKAQEYAATVKLSKGYFCVDSTGAATVTNKKSVSSRDLRCN